MSKFTFNAASGTPSAAQGTQVTMNGVGQDMKILQFPDDLFRQKNVDGKDRIAYSTLFFIYQQDRGSPTPDVMDHNETQQFSAAAGLDYWSEVNTEGIAGATATATGLGNTNGRIRLPRNTSTVKTAIALYMSDQMNNTLQANYNGVNMMERGGWLSAGGSAKDLITSMGKGNDQSFMSAMGSALSIAADKIAGTDVTDLALAGVGKAVNTQEEQLFQNMSFRELQFEYKFTPRHAYETERVKEIIQMFRKHMVPEFFAGSSGRLLITPSFFSIMFIRTEGGAGEENPYVNRFSACALTNVSVDYGPDGGWSVHADGSPTSIRVTLSFRELEMMHRQRIEAGY